MNKTIIEKMLGDFRIYYSADSIVYEDPAEAVNYPPEFLNSVTVSGVAAHT